MDSGYVALLDVLGFSALISGDDETRLEKYLANLEKTLLAESNEPVVESIVFSDTIVLTSRSGDGLDALRALIRKCSSLHQVMLESGIPLRGAIAHGPYYRTRLDNGVFVAGKAIIDAFKFEKQQNWVGITLAPSTLRTVTDIADRCRIIDPHSPAQLRAHRECLPWAAFLQPSYNIPFHVSSPLERDSYHGFAIVPTDGVAEARRLASSLERSVRALRWLKSLAPDPASQAKYDPAIQWCDTLWQQWHEAAFRITQTEEIQQKAEAEARLRGEKGPHAAFEERRKDPNFGFQ